MDFEEVMKVIEGHKCKCEDPDDCQFSFPDEESTSSSSDEEAQAVSQEDKDYALYLAWKDTRKQLMADS